MFHKKYQKTQKYGFKNFSQRWIVFTGCEDPAFNS